LITHSFLHRALIKTCLPDPVELVIAKILKIKPQGTKVFQLCLEEAEGDLLSVLRAFDLGDFYARQLGSNLFDVSFTRNILFDFLLKMHALMMCVKFYDPISIMRIVKVAADGDEYRAKEDLRIFLNKSPSIEIDTNSTLALEVLLIVLVHGDPMFGLIKDVLHDQSIIGADDESYYEDWDFIKEEIVGLILRDPVCAKKLVSSAITDAEINGSSLSDRSKKLLLKTRMNQPIDVEVLDCEIDEDELSEHKSDERSGGESKHNFDFF